MSLTFDMPEQIAGFLAEHGNVAPSDALYAIDFDGDDVRDALGLAALNFDTAFLLPFAAGNFIYIAAADLIPRSSMKKTPR